MKKRLLGIFILILAISMIWISSFSSADSRDAPDLERLLPINELPEKLIVDIESGVAQLFGDHDVKYAIVYLDPPQTNLLTYELASEELAETFFEYISSSIKGQNSIQGLFHEMPSYNIQSETSIYHFWLDQKRIFAVEVERNEPLTEIEKRAIGLMTELLYKQGSERQGLPIAAVIVPLLLLLVIALIVFLRKRKSWRAWGNPPYFFLRKT